ncbi:hypothetical protein MesoLj113c_40170 [Mesorhizobium sp. 113-3-9]|uniref:LssY C-terminal domain-containing protein n=1 Tax=Mesorhizobium sp. 113-3-9 TaxID=2744517 RepID=UPI001928B0AE|nr:LssY C-terminal domain-containing protein [Mesorhizobium sp. 113-3-9]BCG87907.1 hypothetical protein MesoLj113c_40170 [Mesorhizobium sp. 113-3-9]
MLRIWATDIDLRNGHSTELWIGSIVEDSWVIASPSVSQAQPDANGLRDFLAATLDASQAVKRAAERPAISSSGA